MASSMNFQNFSGEWAHRTPPQTPSPSISGFAFERSASSVRAAPAIYPCNMFNNASPNRGVLYIDQTLFSPNPNFLATLVTQYIVPRLRSWIIPVIISLTAGWEDFLKIQRDVCVITGTYSTRNYCTRNFHFSPECTKIVSGWGSAPDPAGGAYSAPPDPLAVMGWDGDLVTTFLGCKLCAPLLVAGAPLLV